VGRVAGKVALITGVSDQVAATSAQRLAEEGAKVAFVDADKARAEAALTSSGLDAENGLAFAKPIADEAAWQAAIESTVKAFGSLDILVNGPPLVMKKPIGEMTLEDLRVLEEHNIVEPWLGFKHAIVAMREAGGGSIVNLSLTLAKVGAEGMAGNCATAGGLRVMAQAAALECGQHSDGIRVNSVLMSHEGGSDPKEVASAVVYFASDESRFMTAGEIVIDSGFLAA